MKGKSRCNNKMKTTTTMTMRDTKKWCKEKKNKIDSLGMNSMKKSKSFRINSMKTSKNSRKKPDRTSKGFYNRYSSITWISSSAKTRSPFISGINVSNRKSNKILGLSSLLYNLKWSPQDIYCMRFAIIGGYISSKKKHWRYSHQLSLSMRLPQKYLLDITPGYININHSLLWNWSKTPMNAFSYNN